MSSNPIGESECLASCSVAYSFYSGCPLDSSNCDAIQMFADVMIGVSVFAAVWAISNNCLFSHDRVGCTLMGAGYASDSD